MNRRRKNPSQRRDDQSRIRSCRNSVMQFVRPLKKSKHTGDHSMLARLLCRLVSVAAMIVCHECNSQDATPKIDIGQVSTLAHEDFYPHTDIVGKAVLVRGPNSNAYAIYSRQNRSWDTYAFPENLRVSHLSLGETGEKSNVSIIGFKISDGPVKELVAINSLGKISKFQLPKTIDGPIVPYLRGNGILIYILAGRIYAYSGLTETWDDIDAPPFKDLVEIDGIVSPPSVAFEVALF